MKFYTALFVLLTSVSCGHLKFDINGVDRDTPVQAVKTNRELWLGRPASEIMTHKSFAVLPLEKRLGSAGAEVLIFKNSGGIYSSSNCAAYGNFGGCSALGSEITCSHVFSVQNNIIKDYDRIGACLEQEDPKYGPIEFGSSIGQKDIGQATRKPASVELKRIIQIDERSGCCSHHGGVSHCSGSTLYCNDGWTSGCGC